MLKVDASEFPTTSTFICRAKGKSAGFCWLWQVRGNNWRYGSVWLDWNRFFSHQGYDILEYVLVGIRTWRFSSKDGEMKESSSLCGAEWRCAITVQRFGTDKCCIHIVSAVFWYALLCKASLVSVPCATMKSQITEIKLLFTWPFLTFLLPLSIVLVIQHVGEMLKITSECNTRWMIKDLTWIHSRS